MCHDNSAFPYVIIVICGMRFVLAWFFWIPKRLYSLGNKPSRDNFNPLQIPLFASTHFCIAIIVKPLRELSSYHHISKKIVWKYYYATILIWSPTNSGVKISVSLKGFRICNNICTPFWGFGSYRPVCLKKTQNLEVSYSSQFWNLNFEISKVNFL